MQEKNTLKQWAIDDQPREKLLAKGKELNNMLNLKF